MVATARVFDDFNVRIYFQYDRRCVPTNKVVVVNEHQLILDQATLVHDKLIDKPLDFIVKHNVRLHLQHYWRRFPANKDIFIDYHQLSLDPTTLVHSQLFDVFDHFFFRLHIQHDW